MSIKSYCIDEIEDFLTAKINFEFAKHEKEEHEMRQEHLPELGRDVQVTRGTLQRCLYDLAGKEKRWYDMSSTGIIEINTGCSDIAFKSCETELYLNDKFVG